MFGASRFRVGFVDDYTCFLCFEPINEDDHEANGGLCDRCLRRETDDESEIEANGL